MNHVLLVNAIATIFPPFRNIKIYAGLPATVTIYKDLAGAAKSWNYFSVN
jgi:hypothetical protein